METALKVVKYIKGEPGKGLFNKASCKVELAVYYDSDWEACPMSRSSITRFFVKLGEKLISWKSKKQHTEARSSAEAEYRSMAMATSEIIWLIGVFGELSVKNLLHVKL
ncbi:uncharacterized mitochondrial protein AtMg00810-like [Hibiscus syriacus]|uniref:uncharacterized mitochondrial protein AtMg00810-like n=1 Tax=Hibiscus syriacus TaxID=106335 RepID=UPI00192457CB|nr:uncharacterized mitochondrial protein AtMg00810-like [Hibiscus syriacus]